MDIRIFPPEDLIEAKIEIPSSKSVSNRVLMINALIDGALPIHNLADCDDTKAMRDGIQAHGGNIDVGAAGTAMRFLTAYYCAKDGVDTVIDGSERMRQRPIGPLVDALNSCGAQIYYVGEKGFPPLKIKGTNLKGGEISIKADISSQFISALMMIAPVMKEGLVINLVGDVFSAPYIRMTAELMKVFGVEVDINGNIIKIPKAEYRPVEYTVDGDWSSASYWYEIEALTSGWVSLFGLVRDSVQGDSRVIRLFENLGVNTEFDGEEGGIDLVASPDAVPRFIADMADTPDLTQTVVVSCAMLGIPFRLTGLRSLHIKETDRIEALKTELMKIGVVLTIESNDIISWENTHCPAIGTPVFDTYNDHRMALAMAPVSLFIPGIVIRNAEVVSKSYPNFWEQLQSVGFKIEEIRQIEQSEEQI